MFPLKKRILNRGAAAHVAAGLGIGGDYEADYVPFYIPFDGVVSTYNGVQGGKWLRLTRPNGDKIELAHLSKYQIKSGYATAGLLGGITGNSGAITTGPHLHIQIINKAGKRLDPEKYIWEEREKMKLVNDKGTTYIITGNQDKRKIGLADLQSLGLFGDEPQESMDTSGIPEYNTIVDGKIITHK